MTTETIQKAGLSKLDLTAMKKANTVVFRHKATKGNDLFGTIECAKKPADNDPFRETHRYLIQVPSLIVDYASKYTSESRLNYASVVILYSLMDATWRTVLAFVRVGDELSLKWLAANNSEVLNQANLFQDQVYLAVHRKDEMYSFLMRVEVCPYNTARMVRCI